MNNETLGGNYDQGDHEYDQLSAQDHLNEEYGAELNNIDAELAAKKALDRQIGQQTISAATEPQVTRIPAADPDQIRAAAAAEEAAGVPLPEASINAQVNNVDAALTDPNAQRATDQQLEKEYKEISGTQPNFPNADNYSAANEPSGQQRA